MEVIKTLKGRIERLESDIKSTASIVKMLENTLSKRRAILNLLQTEKREISKVIKHFEV